LMILGPRLNENSYKIIYLPELCVAAVKCSQEFAG